jgi:Glycerophosphoryl diester phosphodiesterase family
MNKQLSLFLSFLLVLLSASSLYAQSFLNNKIIAHRGAWKNTGAPQNSIASLQNAINLGCTGSEFDVRMTLDNVLVVCHDTHHEGLDIEKTTYADLLKKPLKNGEQIPTFQQYLKVGKKQKKTFLITEIKPSPFRFTQLDKKFNGENCYLKMFLNLSIYTSKACMLQTCIHTTFHAPCYPVTRAINIITQK